MEIQKKQMCVFYIENAKAYFYGSNVPNMLELDFPVDTINDLEVLNKDKLDLLVQNFIQSNNILPTNAIIVLSPLVTFEQDLSKEATTADDEEIINFLEYVPFENVISRAIKLEKKLKLVAVNKEFCDTFKNNLEKIGFHVLSIVPFSVLQETHSELANNLDLQVILDKASSLKQYSLSGIEEPVTEMSKKNDSKKEKKRLYLLVGVFIFLIFALIITIYLSVFRQGVSTSPSSNKVQKKLPAFTPVPFNPSPTLDQENIIISTPTSSLIQP